MMVRTFVLDVLTDGLHMDDQAVQQFFQSEIVSRWLDDETIAVRAPCESGSIILLGHSDTEK